MANIRNSFKCIRVGGIYEYNQLEAVSPVTTNSIEATKRMIMGGYGIGFLPQTACVPELQTGRLSYVLPE